MVEDVANMEYVTGTGFVMRIEDTVIVFKRRKNLYVTDLSSWKQQDMSLVTIMDRENIYMKKDRTRAIEAGEFIENSRYSTKEEVITLVRDRNIENVPHTVEDIKCYYNIYGQDPEFHKGHATKSKPKRKVRFDEGVWE